MTRRSGHALSSFRGHRRHSGAAALAAFGLRPAQRPRRERAGPVGELHDDYRGALHARRLAGCPVRASDVRRERVGGGGHQLRRARPVLARAGLRAHLRGRLRGAGPPANSCARRRHLARPGLRWALPLRRILAGRLRLHGAPGGSVAGQNVLDVAAGGAPGVRRAGASLGPRPAAPPRSTSRRTAAAPSPAAWDLADDVRWRRVMVAPSDPRVVYVMGYAPKVPLVTALSRDGGEHVMCRQHRRRVHGSALGPGSAGRSPSRAGDPAARGRQPGRRQSDLAIPGRRALVGKGVLTLEGTEAEVGFAWSEQGDAVLRRGARVRSRKRATRPLTSTSRTTRGLTWADAPGGARLPARGYRCLGARGDAL